MFDESPTIEIQSRDYWFKIVECLQQNWALIDVNSDGSCTVYFIEDLSGVFDSLGFFLRPKRQKLCNVTVFLVMQSISKHKIFFQRPNHHSKRNSIPTDQFIPQEGSGGNFNMHYQTFERSSLIIVQIIYINRHQSALLKLAATPPQKSLSHALHGLRCCG